VLSRPVPIWVPTFLGKNEKPGRRRPGPLAADATAARPLPAASQFLLGGGIEKVLAYSETPILPWSDPILPRSTSATRISAQ
jgi:hypothetical protein